MKFLRSFCTFQINLAEKGGGGTRELELVTLDKAKLIKLEFVEMHP